MARLFVFLTQAATVLLFCYLNAGLGGKLEHYGNYKDINNSCYSSNGGRTNCPQLSPNFKDEHEMKDLATFRKKSFFACDHRYNSAQSTPADYNIYGNYTRLPCTPQDKLTRDNYTYLGLREAAIRCRKNATILCEKESLMKNFTKSIRCKCCTIILGIADQCEKHPEK